MSPSAWRGGTNKVSSVYRVPYELWNLQYSVTHGCGYSTPIVIHPVEWAARQRCGRRPMPENTPWRRCECECRGKCKPMQMSGHQMPALSVSPASCSRACCALGTICKAKPDFDLSVTIGPLASREAPKKQSLKPAHKRCLACGTQCHVKLTSSASTQSDGCTFCCVTLPTNYAYEQCC